LTAEDQHELLTQLQNPHEPRHIKAQSFCCCLREVNGCVKWVPGTESHLNEGQMRQLFFDSMPTSWREQFESDERSKSSMTLAQILRCFRQEEKLAIGDKTKTKGHSIVIQNEKTINEMRELALMLQPVFLIKNMVLVDQTNHLPMRDSFRRKQT
jgi:hypothetical protein